MKNSGLFIKIPAAFICLMLFQLSFAQPSEVETDSSIIVTRVYSGLNYTSISNKLKDKSKVYYTEIYNHTKNLKEQGVTIDGSAVGKWREFFTDGKLKREIDYDKNAITYVDKSAFPFLEVQSDYKKKGDSIIRKVYGKAFFAKHVVWSMTGSYIYNDDESGGWIDEFKNKPTRFLLRYNVVLDNKVYDDLIEFEIDEKGQFIPDGVEEIYGFEELSKNSPRLFTLSHDKAIAIAKQKGLAETDSTKAEAFLFWESFKAEKFYNGRFRLYVTIKTASIKDIRAGGRSSITDKFDVYVFNPWTAAFIEKKKMKAIRSWEAVSGSSTGLLPDNE